MQIFRRSNLPWADASESPSKAPRDHQVRAWLKGEKLNKAETMPVVRVIEKALARKTATLDLSAATPRMLESLPSSLLIRLREPSKLLKLPANCPADLGANLKLDVRPTSIEPKAVASAIEAYERAHHAPVKTTPVASLLTRSPAAAPAPSPLREPSDKVPGPRESVAKAMRARAPIYDLLPKRNDPIYDVPPSPEITASPIYENQPSSLHQVGLRQREPIDRPAAQPRRLSTEAEINAAWTAVRLLEAWRENHASKEGPAPRCWMSSADADAVARVLIQTPRHLLTEKQQSLLTSAKCILARRLPNKQMQLTPEKVAPLVHAMNVVRILASETGNDAPPLPVRP